MINHDLDNMMMRMRLDLFDLELFLNVVETGSLTKGAERSAISLQASSERIKKLEKQFMVQLFTRHASGVTLTLAGQTFADQAQLVIQQTRQLQKEMLPFSMHQQHVMTLWCNSSAQSEYLPLLLPQYLLENPKTQIDLKEAESNDIIHALNTGTAQLGLISSFFDAGELQTLDFADDPLVIICSSQHPLTQSSSLKLEQILSEPLVGLMPHHSLQQSVETQAKKLGYEIQYRLRLPNFSTIAHMIANHVGIAIIPKRAALRLQTHYDFVYRDLDGAWANRKLLLAAKNFDLLSTEYRHFSQFLIAEKINLSTV